MFGLSQQAGAAASPLKRATSVSSFCATQRSWHRGYSAPPPGETIVVCSTRLVVVVVVCSTRLVVVVCSTRLVVVVLVCSTSLVHHTVHMYSRVL